MRTIGGNIPTAIVVNNFQLWFRGDLASSGEDSPELSIKVIINRTLSWTKNSLRICIIYALVSRPTMNPERLSYFVVPVVRFGKHNKIKRLHVRFQYYENSTATIQIILSGNIKINPGPNQNQHACKEHSCTSKRPINRPKCSEWNKTIRINKKQLICTQRKQFIHVKCANISTIECQTIKASQPKSWTCPQCLLSSVYYQCLPFYTVRDLLDESNNHQIQDISVNNEVLLRVTNHTGQAEKNLLGPAGIRTRDLRYESDALPTELQVKLGARRQMMVLGLFDISKQILVSSISRQ